MGGQLVFGWVRLEKFLITRNRTVGNIVSKSQIQNSKVEYHMCKCSVPSP